MRITRPALSFSTEWSSRQAAQSSHAPWLKHTPTSALQRGPQADRLGKTRLGPPSRAKTDNVEYDTRLAQLELLFGRRRSNVRSRVPSGKSKNGLEETALGGWLFPDADADPLTGIPPTTETQSRMISQAVMPLRAAGLLTEQQATAMSESLREGWRERRILHWLRREFFGEQMSKSDNLKLVELLREMHATVGRQDLWQHRLRMRLYSCLLDAWRVVYITEENIDESSWKPKSVPQVLALSRFRAERGDPYGAFDTARILLHVLTGSAASPTSIEHEQVEHRKALTQELQDMLATAKEAELPDTYALEMHLYSTGILVNRDAKPIREAVSKITASRALDLFNLIGQLYDSPVPSNDPLGRTGPGGRLVTLDVKLATKYYELAASVSPLAARRLAALSYRLPGWVRGSHSAFYGCEPDTPLAVQAFWKMHQMGFPEGSWRLAELLILGRVSQYSPSSPKGSTKTLQGTQNKKESRAGHLRLAIQLLGVAAKGDTLKHAMYRYKENHLRRFVHMDLGLFMPHAAGSEQSHRLWRGPRWDPEEDAEEVADDGSEQSLEQSSADDAGPEMVDATMNITGRLLKGAKDIPTEDNTTPRDAPYVPSTLRHKIAPESAPYLKRKASESPEDKRLFPAVLSWLWTGQMIEDTPAPRDPELPPVDWYSSPDVDLVKLRQGGYGFIVPMLATAVELLEDLEEHGGTGHIVGEEEEVAWFTECSTKRGARPDDFEHRMKKRAKLRGKQAWRAERKSVEEERERRVKRRSPRVKSLWDAAAINVSTMHSVLAATPTQLKAEAELKKKETRLKLREGLTAPPKQAGVSALLAAVRDRTSAGDGMWRG